MEMNRLLRDLKSDDAEVRSDAREELALMMDDDVARAMLDFAVGDADADARADALVAFGPVLEECGDDYSFEMDLGPGTEPALSRDVYELAVRRIREIHDDEAQAKIVRRRALEVLVRDPRPDLERLIRKAYESGDSEWKRTAVFSMGYISGFDREIIESLSSSDRELVYEAVRAAGEMEIEAAARRVRELAQDGTDRDVQIEAIYALPNVDLDAADLLDDLAESDDEEIAEAAEEALEEMQFRQRMNGEDDGEDFDDD